MNTDKIKKGTEVTINIPFLYTIGDVGTYTNKKLQTVDDCINEVRAEIENGALEHEIMLEVGKIKSPNFK